MKLTKLTVILGAAILAPAIALAEPDPTSFQAEKDRTIANILERIQIVQKNLSCVQAAQDTAALKVCHDTVKQERDSLETKIKGQVSDRKAEKGR